MTLTIQAYNSTDANNWDDFCKDSLQATFLHTRRFLSYHGERFIDCSLIIKENDKWIALLPAAISPLDKQIIITHPGLTYGGLLHHGFLRGERMVDSLTAIREYYKSLGFVKFIYKAVPSIYHQVPTQDDLYALFRLGANLIRCDLSSTIDLNNRLNLSERRRRSLKKAIKAGVAIVEGQHLINDFWNILTENLESKHGTTPVHNLNEIILLGQRFPDNIRCVCGTINNEIVAGCLLFITPTTFHSQYIASSTIGYDISALDAIFEYCIQSAIANGKKWFDFGISTEENGQVLNSGLYRFKSEFGSGGTIHQFYEMSLGATINVN